MTRQQPNRHLHLAALGLALAATAAGAAGDRREAGKHEHGASELAIGIDGGDVVIDLEGPAANFVGFEHAPRTPEEQRVLDAALATLRDGAKLFGLPAAAGCRFTGVEVTLPEFAAEAHEAGRPGEPGDHDDHDDHAEADGHAEIAAAWELACAKPAALATVQVKVFEVFPATLRIDAAVAGPAGQTGATLVPGKALLRLAP